MFFEPDTFEFTPMDKNAGSLISRFTKIKERKPGLETWVSVGGWSFNDRKYFDLPDRSVDLLILMIFSISAGKYQHAFSIMSSTAANRATFIKNAMKFMETYGFDGASKEISLSATGTNTGRYMNLHFDRHGHGLGVPNRR